MNRLLIATDAWSPQINGVVRTLEHLVAQLEARGFVVEVISPQNFRSTPMPTYPEIRLALATPLQIARRIRRFAPNYIHVATEGPIGMLVRRWCMRNHHPFTTSYHTKFPEYLRARAPVPIGLSYAWLRRFHNAATVTMVSTPSLERELIERGFTGIRHWSRGVDLSQFVPREEKALDFEGPIFLNVGRVAVEKNIEAFLALDLPGTKVVVGDGPALKELKAKYPQVKFLGPKTGEELARIYASADVFVFPSLTDTFGLVQIEALACGVPVAAFPVTGPQDVLGNAPVGVLSNDLRQASLDCLNLSRTECRLHAEKFSWESCTRQFVDNIEFIPEDTSASEVV